MYYEIKNEYLKVKIDSLGGQLHSILGKGNTEYLWQKDESSWKSQAPNLFPFIGRLTEGKYIYKDKAYEMIKHGFAKLSEMEVIEKDACSISFVLNSNMETKKMYPFDFTYIINYVLEGPKLNICYEVINNGRNEMYFAVGGHPGFNVPLNKGESFEDYCIEFESDLSVKRINMSKECFVAKGTKAFKLKNNKYLELNHSLFDDDAIVLTDMGKKVTLKSKVSGDILVIGFPNMKYLGIWHCAKREVNFVCIEPWTSLPSRDKVVEVIEKQEDFIKLDPEKKYMNSWFIEVVE